MSVHRYTGDWPPPDILEQIPSWIFALDEEGVEGQDETTLKPADSQEVISTETVATAADVELAAGNRCLGIVSLCSEMVESVDYFNGEDWVRCLKDQNTGRWMPFDQSWLPEVERLPTVNMEDSEIFPLKVVTRLPVESTGRNICFEVRGDGTEVFFGSQ